MMRYPDCQMGERSDCSACSLSNYGCDCHNAPVNQIAYFRSLKGYTQQQLADRSGLNIRHVQKLERGERDIGGVSLCTAIAIADALGLDNPKELL